MPTVKKHTLYIKNMVCQRCISSVTGILQKLNIPFEKVTLGEVDVNSKLDDHEIEKLKTELNNTGFELIEMRINKIVESIKKLILQYLNNSSQQSDKKLSEFITDKIHYEYSYLSDLFSSIEGKTIEQFFITQRIEKVKELIVYDQLSLTEIAFQTGFSSVHHLSSQFKKITGLTPSHFKKIGAVRRKSIDSL
ncbi:MAG: helix-turn-helix domain-containing protein [Bacteroidota bacterium]